MVAVDWKFVEEISRFARDDELLELSRGEPRKKRASARKKERRADGKLGRKGVVDLATSPTAKHAATLLDGHARLRETSERHTERCAQQGEAR